MLLTLLDEVEDAEDAETLHLLVESVAKDLDVVALFFVGEGLVAEGLLESRLLVSDQVELGAELQLVKAGGGKGVRVC